MGFPMRLQTVLAATPTRLRIRSVAIPLDEVRNAQYSATIAASVWAVPRPRIIHHLPQSTTRGRFPYRGPAEPSQTRRTRTHLSGADTAPKRQDADARPVCGRPVRPCRLG